MLSEVHHRLQHRSRACRVSLANTRSATRRVLRTRLWWWLSPHAGTLLIFMVPVSSDSRTAGRSLVLSRCASPIAAGPGFSKKKSHRRSTVSRIASSTVQASGRGLLNSYVSSAVWLITVFLDLIRPTAEVSSLRETSSYSQRRNVQNDGTCSAVLEFSTLMTWAQALLLVVSAAVYIILNGTLIVCYCVVGSTSAP